MSLSPHRRGTLSSTQHGEAAPHPDLFYDVAARPVDQTHSSPEGMMDSSPEVQSAGLFKSEARGPFQPPEPVKWPQPDPSWFQGPQSVTKWPPHFGPCVGDDPGAFQKSEMDGLQSDGLSQSSTQSYTDPGSVEYVHHAPFHRPAEFHYQPTGHHDRPDPTLQPFQLAFRPAKPPPAPAFQQGFEGTQHQQQFLQLQQLNQMQQFHQLQHQHQQQQRMHQMQHQYQLQHHTQVQSEPSKGGTHTLHQGAEPDPQETPTKHPAAPRRSRRLSRDGLSPPALQTCKENGAVGGVQGSVGGVIQSTQRRRRASKEINLETLAQKASEMEFLPAKSEDGMIKPASITPLVIPVSVPVHPEPPHPDGPSSWREKDDARLQRDQPHHKPSVIVARRFSLKNSASESITQGDKSRHRPRPEPLVMPKLGTFIAPSIYSSISHHQSNLRSPVGLPDHSSLIPPYTPPPILSPVREGSGLYFSAVLSSMAASSQVLPPPSTPRGGATRSLLRSGSSDLTPPALPLHVEATPVCLEPRINIGSQYQAEIPDLQEQTLAHTDQHKATLVWLPVSEIDSSPFRDSRVVDLVNVASSSVLHGGGTNTELAMHCLHECRGDVMKTLEVMLMKSPIFSAHHPLSDYHYAGSDCWTADEKRYFNKGICAYTKDFFLVQKVVRSKTVAQCVEFYYTYKKQVKAGRGGAVTFGPAEPEESIFPVMNVKQDQAEDDGDNAPVFAPNEGEHFPANVILDGHTHQGADAAVEEQRSFPVKHASGLTPSCPAPFKAPPPAAQRRSSAAPKKSRSAAGNKLQGEPEGIFPCKKCSRVFYKVKSRSAHMKSHAEQEKKAAAAQRQREEEERARQEVLEAAARKRQEGREESSGAEDSSLEPDDELDEDWH